MTIPLGPPPFTGMLGTAASRPAIVIPAYHATAQPPNPLLSPLAQGGGDRTEWWQQRKDVFNESYGYVRLAPDFDPQVDWEFGESAFTPGKPVTLQAFTSRLVSEALREEASRETVVEVTITVAGVSYTARRVLKP